MLVELEFFSQDTLLCRGGLTIGPQASHTRLESTSGKTFEITHQFEEPACRVFIKCFHGGASIFQSAMRMGVHNSVDWEAIELFFPYRLGFKCTIHDLPD